MDVAVALFVFNRPDKTARVFQAIRQAQPSRLLVVADGPRNNDEAGLCRQTREATECIDWPCDVRRHYAPANLGCKVRMSSGVSWVFEQVEEAILLEDDCLPDPTFFEYCRSLLETYRHDERVVHIGGNNLQLGSHVTEDSYYFSAVNHIWGWATWRRAWKHYDVAMSQWPEVRDGGLLEQLWGEGSPVAAHFRKAMERVYRGEVDTWDSQWTLTCWLAGGLSILPARTLVSNIGFGPGATHTHSTRSVCANLPSYPVEFPLRHPPSVQRNFAADEASLMKLVASKNL